ncbi:5-oxoprolinase subunit PxpB [Paenibacillus sp. MER 99-2]|uniref:5-oxoprolinase subunit PxpB n=1 Tax=Paenibacillus sp. MER 99-2 TaxID=2939572 RepID=UPI00204217F6|nr:5-oxoprolinase subunit PxpB [Paenibacillus sp. MER 99-2]MCM3174722.1 5-oxoprolinase subunit PxpB [Paenibacillus sp. MER 99-2]
MYMWTEEMVSPLSESTIIIRCGDMISDEVHQRVMSVCSMLEQDHMHIPGIIEAVPSFASVTLFYDPYLLMQHMSSSLDSTSTTIEIGGSYEHPRADTSATSPYIYLRNLLLSSLQELQSAAASKQARTVTIPVCYGGEFGPDLEYVASVHALTPDEVIAIHTAGEYLVHMLGFAPGFPYLGGLSARIATPRRATPRLRVEAGTVGIGGEQTGIYPLATPGGWQCIGRTPIPLFRPDDNPPSLLTAGDRVRFTPISIQEYFEHQGAMS